MPSWIIHIAISNRIINKINIKNKEEYLFANVAPDILQGYIINDISEKKKYEITHFAQMVERNGRTVPLPNLEEFKNKYIDSFKNEFILGYYTHLLTDYFWNNFCYSNYFYNYDKSKNLILIKQLDGKEEIKTWNEGIAEKQKDFRIFSKYIQNKLEINYNFDIDKILEDSKDFYIKYKDISNTINYLKNIKNLEFQEEHYTIFNEEKMKEIFEKSIDFIIEKIMEVI